MNDFELGRQRREQRALERLGSNNPSCVICRCDDPFALELHHIAGRAFDNETVPVCRNCHRVLSDRQKDHPPSLTNPPSDLECTGHALLGLADMFELLVKWLREHAKKLFAAAGSIQNSEEAKL
jgi:hypothetical protein